MEGWGSARRGAPGACAVRPQPRPPPPAAYFSPSGCGRGDPTRAEEPPDPPNLRGLGVWAPVEPPRRCPPRPAARCSKLWPAPPRLGARDQQVRSGGARRTPGARLFAASRSRAKSGSESWIPAPRGATWRAPAPRLLLAGRALSGASPSLEAALLRGSRRLASDPQGSAAATRVWERQRPRALGPHRVPVPALCLWQVLGELGRSSPRRAPGVP